MRQGHEKRQECKEEETETRQRQSLKEEEEDKTEANKMDRNSQRDIGTETGSIGERGNHWETERRHRWGRGPGVRPEVGRI